MTFIYGLHHPETGELRYVGKANHVQKRLKSHLRDARRRNTPLYCWMRTLSAPPRIEVLEEVEDADWKEAERRLVALHRSSGRLLNLADGGDEPMCPVEVRAENGRKNAKAIQDDPIRKQLWLVKKQLGQALRRGHVSDHAKQKMRAAAAKYPQYFGAWATI
jgi:hypothetical protein